MNIIKSIYTSVFGKSKFEKAFELYKDKVTILMRKYHSEVAETLTSFTNEYDGINVSFELRKRNNFYNQRINELLNEMLELFAGTIIKYTTKLDNDNEIKIRTHLQDIVKQSKNNYIRGLEEFLTSIDHKELINILEYNYDSIRKKANEKISSELSNIINEKNLETEIEQKKEFKSKLKELFYNAIKVVVGIVIGYLISLIIN